MTTKTKADLIEKVYKTFMGAYEFTSGKFQNKTKPILSQLLESAKTVDDLIKALLDSRIMNVSIVATETKERWDPTKETLMVFLTKVTHWNFMLQGFNDYFKEAESDGELNSIMFIRKLLNKKQREKMRLWLLES